MGERVEEATVDQSRLVLLVQAVGLKLSDPDVEEFVALGLQETNISSQDTFFLVRKTSSSIWRLRLPSCGRGCHLHPDQSGLISCLSTSPQG